MRRAELIILAGRSGQDRHDSALESIFCVRVIDDKDSWSVPKFNERWMIHQPCDGTIDGTGVVDSESAKNPRSVTVFEPLPNRLGFQSLADTVGSVGRWGVWFE